MIYNKRDLGGIAAADGRFIRPGLLIRSALLARAEETDLEGVSLIIDLRTPMEQEMEPDRTFGRTYLPLSILENETAGITHERRAKEAQAAPDMASLYALAMQRCTAAFRKVLLAIMTHDLKAGAVLWHCAGGKDRTGMVAALLLEALGVNRKIIMEDYLQTNVSAREQLTALYGEGFDRNAYAAWFADETYLEAAWTAMGSRYIEDTLRIDPAVISVFRERALAKQ